MRYYKIIDGFTGEVYETKNESEYNAILFDLINQYNKEVFNSPIDNESIIFYKPVKVVKECFNFSENTRIIKQATITTYKNIYNPYSTE